MDKSTIVNEDDYVEMRVQFVWNGDSRTVEEIQEYIAEAVENCIPLDTKVVVIDQVIKGIPK